MGIAIYARVSTDEQTNQNQEFELKKVAKRMGWTVTAVYADTISGAKSKRPELDSLLKSAMRQEIDVIMAWSVDRIGRSFQHLVTLLADIQSKDVDLYLHQQRIDTTTPSGKAMYGMMGVFAEFERAMIAERVKAGLKRARDQGKRLGRPPVPPIQIEKIRRLRAEGMTLTAIAKRVELSVGKVHSAVEHVR